MGRPTGLEPATPRFTILCSNQLSYDRRKEPAKFASPPTPVNPFLEAAFRPAVAGSGTGFPPVNSPREDAVSGPSGHALRS